MVCHRRIRLHLYEHYDLQPLPHDPSQENPRLQRRVSGDAILAGDARGLPPADACRSNHFAFQLRNSRVRPDRHGRDPHPGLSPHRAGPVLLRGLEHGAAAVAHWKSAESRQTALRRLNQVRFAAYSSQLQL